MTAFPHLTDEQRAVVRHDDGHARVSAVAGSGKTATLVARVLHLLEHGADPRRILVLMFNVSARRDFAERLARAAAGRFRTLPEVRTFHSLGLRITQACERRGVLPRYRLVTQDWQALDAARTALEQALTTAGVRDAENLLSKERVEAFATFIGLVKADVVSAQELFDRLGLDDNNAYFTDAYRLFETRRRQDRIRFYSDLIHEPVMALRKDPTVATWIGNHMDHIVLDEYQDINEVQQQLVKAVAGRRARVMAVGDVDQCVYEWRGARPEFMISRFFDDFPDATRYNLTHTFRFGHRLALLADHAIAHNLRRDERLCLSAPGTPDTQVERRPESAAKHPILAILSNWVGNGRRLAEAAILLRLYSMSVPLELALLSKDVPYRLEGHDTLFQCPEIRSLLGHLRLAAGALFGNADTLETVETMLRVPQLGFKKAEIGRIAAAITKHPDRPADVLEGLMTDDMSRRQRGRIATRTVLWQQLRRKGGRAKAWRVLEQVIQDAELYDFFQWSSPTPVQAEEKEQMCASFLTFAREGNLSVDEFLQLVAEMSTRTANPQGDTLLITSIHRAKGLEWPLVILPGLTEGRFPYYRDPNEADSVEDERRLFYVGCTRARERLYLIHPPDPDYERHDQSLRERAPPPLRCSASRFLYEARVALSQRVGAALTAGATLDLSAHAPVLVNRYLKAVNAEFRVTGKSAGGKKQR
jgi:DNA helicase-2/ATP-dependent DNA helicase PcrA